MFMGSNESQIQVAITYFRALATVCTVEGTLKVKIGNWEYAIMYDDIFREYSHTKNLLQFKR